MTATVTSVVSFTSVASVVSDWTGIPVGRMVKDEIETVMNLNALLGARVIGQDHALDVPPPHQGAPGLVVHAAEQLGHDHRRDSSRRRSCPRRTLRPPRAG